VASAEETLMPGDQVAGTKAQKVCNCCTGAEDPVQKAREWVTSPEGQEALKAALERARKLADQFWEASRIDPRALR
jgi:hypothetical protein